MAGHNVEFTKTELSSALNGLFTKDGLKEMLEGKDYLTVYAVFPFVGTFADGFFGRTQQHGKKYSHTMYTQRLDMVTGAVAVHIVTPVTP